MTRRYTVLALSLALFAGAGLLLALNLKPRSDLDFLLRPGNLGWHARAVGRAAQSGLLVAPSGSRRRDVRALLLGGVGCLFLRLSP